MNATQEDATGEKFDEQKMREAHLKFVELTEQRALGDMRGRDRADIWVDTSSAHPEGRKAFAEWKHQDLLKKREELARSQALRRGSGGFANAELIPVKNPRSVALVGLTMSASDAEFAQAWEKFQGKGVVKTPTNPAPATEKDPRQGFMDEVSKLQAEGHNYQDSWIIASTTEPGKSLYAAWADECKATKLSGELKF